MIMCAIDCSGLLGKIHILEKGGGQRIERNLDNC